MARFYGEVKGSAATSATRMGRDKIVGHIRGWNLGAEVTLFVNEQGQDEMVIRVTGGSNSPNGGIIIYHDSTKGDGLKTEIGSTIRIVLAPAKLIDLKTED